jgi:anti-sigma regulatory factor (Ser/Thr protein kinase)
MFSPRPDQIAAARAFVRGALDAQGGDRRLDDAVLMASELVTNAVTYGRGDMEVAVTASGGRVRVEVSQASAHGGTPHLKVPGPTDIGGRGLGIVDQLAEIWGTERGPGDQLRVWFELGTGVPGDRASDRA